jgi:hypothetical protein
MVEARILANHVPMTACRKESSALQIRNITEYVCITGRRYTLAKVMGKARRVAMGKPFGEGRSLISQLILPRCVGMGERRVTYVQCTLLWDAGWA